MSLDVHRITIHESKSASPLSQRELREIIDGLYRADFSDRLMADKLRRGVQAVASALIGRYTGLRGDNLFRLNLSDLEVAWDATDPCGGYLRLRICGHKADKKALLVYPIKSRETCLIVVCVPS